jgi:tetratricopeptide (TPR) repeat protein
MKSIRLITGIAAMAGLMFVLVTPAAGKADAEQRLADAERVYRSEGPEAALPLFDELSVEYRASGDKKAAAVAIGYIGEIHWRLGNYEQAGKYLDQALMLKRQNGDRLQQGKTLNVFGLLNWDLGNYDQAKAYFQQGAEIAEEMDDRRLAGAILNNLSLVYDELGDYYVSLEQYQRVLNLYKGVDFPRGEGEAFTCCWGTFKKRLDTTRKLLRSVSNSILNPR